MQDSIENFQIKSIKGARTLKVIQHIYELEYNTTTYPKRVVLFYCHWFDPTSRGTRVDPKYGTVEIQMDKSKYIGYSL